MSYDGERLTLHDWRIEASLLAAMTLHGRICDVGLERLMESDFYRPAHQTLFRALGAIRASGAHPDSIVLVDELAKRGELSNVGGADYIETIVHVVGNVNGHVAWIDRVRTYSNLRSLQASLDAAEETLHTGGSYADVVAALGPLDAVGSLAGIVEAHDVLKQGPLPKDVGYPTGIPLIDNETSTGGAATGQMCVVMASEGVGKSTLLLQIATHAAWSNRGVLYITMADLNRQRLVGRVLRMRCGYSSQQSADRDGEIGAYIAAEGKLKSLSFGIDDRTKKGSKDVDDIIETIEARKYQLRNAEVPLQEVFVDYAQKLTSRRFKSNDAYAMSVYCSSRLSEYAERSGLTIWVGSQKTDGSEKHGTRDKTKGGNHWLEDAGLGLVMWSPAKANDRKFQLPKSRFGGQWQETDMVFNENYLLFLPPGVTKPW